MSARILIVDDHDTAGHVVLLGLVLQLDEACTYLHRLAPIRRGRA